MASSAGEKGGVFASLRSRSPVATTLDFAGGHVGVFEAGGAAADLAGGGDDELGTGGFALGVGFRGTFFIEHDLDEPGAVADVEEDEVAVVAAAVDPTHDDDGVFRVRAVDFSAHVRALEGAEEVECHDELYCTDGCGRARHSTSRSEVASKDR